MSTSTANSLGASISTLKGNRDSSTKERVLLGARFRIHQWISTEMIAKRFKGVNDVKRRRDCGLRITCCEGCRMRVCEVEATICIEAGKEGDSFYSKHEFDAVFKGDQQEEIFKLKNGLILRYGNMKAGAFDNSVFDEDSQHQFHVTLTVHSVKELRMMLPPIINFRDSKSLHDVILIMDDGTKFYVQWQTLSSHSGYFLRMFHSDFAESKQQEIPISEVEADDLELMLRANYPFPPEITWRFLDKLFILADRFDFPSLTQKCIDFLSREDNWKAERHVFDMLYWADKYNLLELQSVANRTLKKLCSLNAHIKNNGEEFNELPFSVRERLLNSAFEMRGVVHLNLAVGTLGALT